MGLHFHPEGFTETYAEMGDRKNSVSMRKALEALAAHLTGRQMLDNLARVIYLGRAALFVGAGVSTGLGLPHVGS